MPRNLAGPAPLHLVDATMLWHPRAGSVRRYLHAKHAVFDTRPAWRHTLVAPGASGHGMVDSGGLTLPGSPGRRFLLGRSAAAQTLAQQRPDIVEAGDFSLLAWAALDAARKCRVPSVLFCHVDIASFVARALGSVMGAHVGSAAHRAVSSYVAQLCNRFDLVLAPSIALQLELIEQGVRRVRHQPMGVDTRVFQPAARDEAWRDMLRLPTGARVLLYAGRFTPDKNLDLLVQAVQRLGPRYRLVAMGDGPAPPSGRQVTVLPFERNPAAVARAMASADGVLHAGDHEACGLAVLEAMACGTPVAARAAGGLRELVAAGRGIAVESADVDAWAEAIDALTNSSAHERAGRAHAWARTQDWRSSLALLRLRYECLLGRRTTSSLPSFLAQTRTSADALAQ
jgi:alpha-1,6-mannosyltransferase